VRLGPGSVFNDRGRSNGCSGSPEGIAKTVAWYQRAECAHSGRASEHPRLFERTVALSIAGEVSRELNPDNVAG